MPKELLIPRARFSLKLPPLPDEPPEPLLPGGGDQGGRTPRIAISMDGFHLPPMEEVPILASSLQPYVYKGHLYKTQLGSSLPDLSARLQRQRSRLPRQFEKISFQVRTDGPLQGAARSRMGYLPVLTPRTPVVVECRANTQEAMAEDTSRASGTGSEAHFSHHPQVMEIHADVLDQTFLQHAKPGARPPWRADCFCPRCGFEREQWVERNRKPFRPFSRQREMSFMSLSQPIGKDKSLMSAASLDSQQHQQKVALNIDNNNNVNAGPPLRIAEGGVTFRPSREALSKQGSSNSKGRAEESDRDQEQSSGSHCNGTMPTDKNTTQSNAT